MPPSSPPIGRTLSGVWLLVAISLPWTRDLNGWNSVLRMDSPQLIIPNWVLGLLAVNLIFMTWAQYLSWWEPPARAFPLTAGYGLFQSLRFASDIPYQGDSLGVGLYLTVGLFAWMLLDHWRRRRLGKVGAEHRDVLG